MTKQEIFDLTSPTREMPCSTFEQLMKNVKLSTHSETDISFESNFNNYEIFFGMSDNELYIEYFGFNRNGWIELEPSANQIEIMTKMLKSIPSRPIEPSNDYLDLYTENGISREDFY